MRTRAATDEIMRLSQSIVGEMVPPLTRRAGICAFCHTWTQTANEESCENCHEVLDALGEPPLALSVVSLYAKPSQLRDWLTRYKGRDDDGDEQDEASGAVVRSMVGRFIVEHGQELHRRLGGYDAIVVVPSTSREPPHPLADILTSLELDVPIVECLKRGSGPLGFRAPHPDGYEARNIDAGLRTLLVDDVYTTGARLNSAAYAIRSTGGIVAGAFVIARRVNPQYSSEAALLWQEARRHTFDWARSPRLIEGVEPR